MACIQASPIGLCLCRPLTIWRRESVIIYDRNFPLACIGCSLPGTFEAVTEWVVFSLSQ